ncbi:MAG TPA: glutaredoxin 3 [Xanthobacteraceae bacterium]|nr:glutaredoxin 3 [Xanthobacteraceae bacterium]
MTSVEIYTRQYCPYCHFAKELLSRKGVSFREIDVTVDPTMRQRMIERANGSTSVPQVFIGSTHVGGCDELYALDEAGELDPLLGQQPAPPA